MPIISLAIQKGGSGKTTTAINLAAALQHLDQTVLVVDLDPQSNLTQSLGYDEPEPNLYNLFKIEMDGEESDIRTTILESNGLSFVPSSLELASAELEIVSAYGREKILGLMLQPIAKDYDFILIDCPPAIGMLTVNALACSQYVLMPLQAEFLPMKGVQSFMRSFKRIKRQLNPQLELLGFVLTKFDRRKSMNRHILEQLEQEFGDKVFETRIRSNIALAHAQQYGVDIFHFDKSSKGAFDYMQLAQELLKRLLETS